MLCTFPSSCARFTEVVHVSQKLCTFHKPPNNVRIQLYTHWAHSSQQKYWGDQTRSPDIYIYIYHIYLSIYIYIWMGITMYHHWSWFRIGLVHALGPIWRVFNIWEMGLSCGRGHGAEASPQSPQTPVIRTTTPKHPRLRTWRWQVDFGP